MRILAAAFTAVMVVVDQVQQQLSQLIVNIPSVAKTTYSMALIVLTFLFLILFGEIIYKKKKKKVTSFSTNSAVEESKMSVDGSISASDADITSDGGSIQEVDDAMTRHSDSITFRCVVSYSMKLFIYYNSYDNYYHYYCS
jgi:hypothetical protein